MSGPKIISEVIQGIDTLTRPSLPQNRTLLRACTYDGGFLQELDTFFSYFHDTYIGSTYSPPLLPSMFWNVHGRVLDNKPRTNNIVEGRNNKFNRFAENCHVPFHKIIKLLKQEQDFTASENENGVAGSSKPYVRKRYVQLNQRIPT